MSRNQLMLYFSCAEIQEYIINRMSDILSNAPTSYVKWDLNRNICDKYNAVLDADKQGKFSRRYVLGLYRVLETLTGKFPHVFWEDCHGGGDVLMRVCFNTPQTWCNNNGDAVSRLDITPYTPKINPIKQIWMEIRKRGFSNRLFSSLEQVVDCLCDSITSLSPEVISSITACDWIVKSFY